jgi:hypothetical protein
MKTTTAQLIERIKERPAAFFIQRTEANYDLFLDLYRRVGYAPSQPDSFEQWQERSRATWALQDMILPGSCTGGMDGDILVSSWGTLPLAKSVLYGHSVCMVKTLASAATLFAQSLHSLGLFEAIPEMSYWAGSYERRSRFTSLFQRPLSGPIQEQLEIEAIEVLAEGDDNEGEGATVREETIGQEHLDCIDPSHRRFFQEVSQRHGLLAQIHTVRSFTVRDVFSGALRGLALVQAAPSEFTAANVFSRTWVFLTNDTDANPVFIRAIRSAPALRSTGFEILLPRNEPLEAHDPAESTVPFFWALTPKSQVDALRKSFEDAFGSLLDRYSDECLVLLER